MNNLSRREREKKIREEEIITAAEKIFTQKGFEETSMDEIAKEAQFTKRTLYQYFTNKEDLYFAVAIKVCKLLFSYIEKASINGNNGFEKLRLSILGYYNFYKDYPEMLLLTNHIGYVKQKSEKTPKMEEWLQLDNYTFQKLTKILEDGKLDGSIRNDIDVTKLTYSYIFLMSGFFQMLSYTGKSFMKHCNLNEEEFVSFTLNLLGESIRAK
ncbi:MAG: TetR family transcriptional regulator [Spirochaetes bacterium GWD1_27_9]|nr:MAG: TetR family transcriptional regulator [Spirochaetes bacterium GWB1_27_13]OHD23759.1 MAG: TetR family transcriptional regulator [Spirochaetes bacterium GWC1_27_15]OHD41546.1 MAG: TetR family transcriptional regulator [Spirochaetes bacterium GWD1_27_9]